MTYSSDLKERVLSLKKTGKYTDKEIIEIFKISNGTFYGWIKNNNKIKKRKLKIDSSIQYYVVNYVIRHENFDYKKLIKNINKKFKKTISPPTIYSILKKNRIKKKIFCIKQIYTNEEKRKAQINFFLEQIKDLPHDIIISLDETSTDTHICNNKGWSEKGKKIILIKKHYRIRYTTLCAISNKKIIHKKTILGSANAIFFLEFIKILLKKLKENNSYHIILDNCRIHHSKIFKDFIKEKNNIHLIYNIPYSPETNPIELLFNEFKKNLRNYKNNNTNTLKNIEKSFGNINKDNFKQYYEKSLNFYTKIE